ncbi:MAG: hydroxymethylbilane synthase, partial [Gemmataceae bacterium]
MAAATTAVVAIGVAVAMVVVAAATGNPSPIVIGGSFEVKITGTPCVPVLSLRASDIPHQNSAMKSVRLGTRSSALALWQARTVAELLRPVLDPHRPELVLIDTHGDRDQNSALSAMGGFGVFTRSIQSALLDDRADVAVHSLKDLPTIPVPGLKLVATPARGPTGDAFVSTKFAHFADLPRGAVIGTSSLRRRAMIRNVRPDVQVVELRGNVETRLRKL